jgi:hypothetical protein
MQRKPITNNILHFVRTEGRFNVNLDQLIYNQKGQNNNTNNRELFFH